jgi:hypothetical protein
MTRLTVEIDKDQDLSVLQDFLNQMGLKFDLEEDDDSSLKLIKMKL